MKPLGKAHVNYPLLWGLVLAISGLVNSANAVTGGSTVRGKLCSWWQSSPAGHVRVALFDRHRVYLKVVVTGDDGFYYFDQESDGQKTLFLNVPDSWPAHVQRVDILNHRPALVIDVREDQPYTDITPIRIPLGRPGLDSFQFGCEAVPLPAPKYEPSALRTLPLNSRAKGISASDYDGEVDWGLVKGNGYEFAVVKATEGSGFVAQTFNRNWESLRKARMIRGAYHFFRPAMDAKLQAEFFLANAPLEPGDLPPVLVWEVLDRQAPDIVVRRVGQWLSLVESIIKRKPIIYTSSLLLARAPQSMTAFSGYPLWIAHYTQADQPQFPPNWDTWALWEFTNSGQVNGVQGRADVNYFNGTLADLRRFTGVEAPP